MKSIQAFFALIVFLATFAWRNIWRYPKRSILLLVVIFLGVFATLFFTSLMQAWGQSMLNQTLNSLGAEVLIEAKVSRETPKNHLNDSALSNQFLLSETQLEQLKTLPYKCTGRLKLDAILQSEYEIAPTALMAIDLKEELPLSQIGRFYVHQQHLEHTLKSADYAKFSSPFSTQNPYQIILGDALLKQLNTQVGRRIVLMTHDQFGNAKEIGLTIVDHFSLADSQAEKAQVYTPLSSIQHWLNLPNQINQLACRQTVDSTNTSLEQQIEPSYLAKMQQDLSQIFPNQSQKTWQTLQPFAHDSIQMMLGFNWVWVLLIGVLMLFGLLNTLSMMLYERRQEWSNLHTLGLSQTRLRTLILLELILVISLASLLAWAAIYLLIENLPNGIDLTAFAEGSRWLGVERTLILKIDSRLWLTTTFELCGLLILLTSFIVLRATRLANLRPQRTSP